MFAVSVTWKNKEYTYLHHTVPNISTINIICGRGFYRNRTNISTMYVVDLLIQFIFGPAIGKATVHAI
jgi:hypothetical protein